MTDRFPPPGYFLRVKDWDEHFERAQTRKIKGPLSWVSIPTAQDGLKFTHLMRHKNGPSVLGIFIMLVEIAAKSPNRGEFRRHDGYTLTTNDLAAMSGAHANAICSALKVLMSNEIGWIEMVECSQDNSSAVVARSDMEEERKGEGEGEGARARGFGPKPNLSDREFFDHLQQLPAYKLLDVRAVWDKLEAHCLALGEEPTRKRLVAWLNKERPADPKRKLRGDETAEEMHKLGLTPQGNPLITAPG